MKDLITAIVQALVDQPEEVSVSEVGGAHTIVLEVSVAKSDMGKVIGKRNIFLTTAIRGKLWFKNHSFFQL